MTVPAGTPERVAAAALSHSVETSVTLRRAAVTASFFAPGKGASRIAFVSQLNAVFANGS